MANKVRNSLRQCLVNFTQLFALAAVFLPLRFFMEHQKFASHDAYPPAAGESRSFDTLSRILVTLMCAAIIVFALLMLPVSLSPLMENLLGWCVAGLLGALVSIVVVGLIEHLAD